MKYTITKLLFLSILLSFSFTKALASDDIKEQLAALDAMYEKQDWASAMEKGEELYEINGDDTDLLLFLGNTAYHLNDLAKARWYFERGLYLDPYCTSCKENIDVLRRELVEIEEERFILDTVKQKLYFIAFSSFWELGALLFMVFGLVFFLMKKRNTGENRGLLSKQWPMVLTYSLAFLFLITAFGRAAYLKSSSKYIVSERAVLLRESPEEQSSILNTLRPGNLLFQRVVISEWMEVEMTNGTKGWVETSALRAIQAQD